MSTENDVRQFKFVDGLLNNLYSFFVIIHEVMVIWIDGRINAIRKNLQEE